MGETLAWAGEVGYVGVFGVEGRAGNGAGTLLIYEVRAALYFRAPRRKEAKGLTFGGGGAEHAGYRFVGGRGSALALGGRATISLGAEAAGRLDGRLCQSQGVVPTVDGSSPIHGFRVVYWGILHRALRLPVGNTVSGSRWRSAALCS